MKLRHEIRGAALVLVVAMLALLLALTIAFYTTSRLELRLATSARDAAQSQFSADAGIAIAQGFLRHDLLAHPTITSLDHAWRSYFEGSWYAGKPWMWRRDADTGMPLSPLHPEYGGQRGTPHVPFEVWYNDTFVKQAEVDGEPRRREEALYIPRIPAIVRAGHMEAIWAVIGGGRVPGVYQQSLNNYLADFADQNNQAIPFYYEHFASDVAAFPFLTPDGLVTDAFEPDRFPTRAEMVNSYADVDLSGDGLRDAMWIPIPMERLYDNDGIDNNLDGRVDDPGETAPFVYFHEALGTLRLTAPILVDLTGDGQPDPLPNLEIPQYDTNSEYDPVTGTYAEVLTTWTLNPNPGSEDIDYDIDHDHSFVASATDGFAFPRFIEGVDLFQNPAATPAHIRGQHFNVINPAYFASPVLHPDTGDEMLVSSTGEHICDIVGRIAVLITDEASKANINVAHAMRYERVDSTVPFSRAVNLGLGTHEYDLRVLPGMETALATRFATFRTGAPRGIGFGASPDAGLDPFLGDYPQWMDPFDAAYEAGNLGANPWALQHDVSLPGYGLVDDNGNAFWAAYNGLDVSGDGLRDTGVFLPAPNHPEFENAFLRLGFFEGIDDPSEMRMFRPHRNRIAEEISGEFGYLGDRFFRTREEIKEIYNVAGARYSWVRDLITVHSADRNDRYNYRSNLPVYSGAKPDYNFAVPEQLATALINDWSGFRPLPDTIDERLRHGSMRFEDGPQLDGALRAHELAATIRDNRDSDNVRSDVAAVMPGEGTEYTVAGVEGVRINEVMVRATRRVEAEAVTEPTGAVVGTLTDDPSVRTDLYPNQPVFPNGMDLSVIGQQFYPNAFSGSRPDFDVQRHLIPTNLVLPINGFSLPRPTIQVVGRNDVFMDYDPSHPTGPLSVPIGVQQPNPPHIGMKSYVSFQGPIYNEFIGDYEPIYEDVLTLGTFAPDDTPVPYEVPNLIVFRFGPGPGLPPGRYYLKANTTRDGNADTATVRTEHMDSAGRTSHMQYIMKYGTEDESILRDVAGVSAQTLPEFLDLLDRNAGHFARSPASQFMQIGRPIVGTRKLPLEGMDLDYPTGYVLMPSRPAPVPQLIGTPWAGYGGRDEFYANTVVIPPYAGPGEEQEYLYVAVWRDPSSVDDYAGHLRDLAINYFEFSQEPMHEYVELVNVSDETVDVSGWSLEVGQFGGAGLEDDHLVMRIPSRRSDAPEDRVEIAPGGRLLLTVGKYDVGANPYGDLDPVNDPFFSPSGAWPVTGINPLFQNGIGMAATDALDFFPMFGLGLSMATSVTVPPMPTPSWDDAFTGFLPNFPVGPSIFFRSFDEGMLTDYYDPEDAEWLSATLGGRELDDSVISTFPDEFPQRYGEFLTTQGLAELQTFPDGTERYVWLEPATKPWDRIVQLESRLDYITSFDELATIILNGGIFPNAPSEDWIDNDHSNADMMRVREEGGFHGWLRDPDSLEDPFPPYPGIDEGRLWLEMRRRHNPFTDGLPIPVPGAYYGDPSERLGLAEYIGGDYPDTPEWRAFIERRFFPGDTVRVTLYQGDPSPDRIVDRVTYTQVDVENRAIDDGIVCPYTNEANQRVHLSGQPTWWPPNTMGVDFYRALERKHPLYLGDRFGTTTADRPTDGNYDDWDSGQGPIIAIPDEIIGEDEGTIQDLHWTNLADWTAYAHRVSGSPLRPSFFEFALRNEGVTARIAHGDDLPAWHLAHAGIRNRAYGSAGDLATLPHVLMTKSAIVDPDEPDRIRMQEVVEQVMAGRSRRASGDLTAIMETGAPSARELSVATAEFYPLNYADPEEYPDAHFWDEEDRVYPTRWSPLYLYPLGETPGELNIDDDPLFPALYPAHQNFLFRSPEAMARVKEEFAIELGIGGPVPAPYPFPDDTFPAALNDRSVSPHLRRWPLDKRAVMYVSANPADYAAGSGSGSEALFVWGAEAGIENGEYDVYIATADNLDGLRRLPDLAKDVLFSDRLVTVEDVPIHDVGMESLLRATRFTVPDDLPMTVEVFTDRTGNRRFWQGSIPTVDTLNRQSDPEIGRVSESFGVMPGAKPSPDGLIHYGRVRVENNMLGLRIANEAPGGVLNRFSRVILVGTRRTLGRININTATTEVREGAGAVAPRNVMTGIPGILAEVVWPAVDEEEPPFIGIPEEVFPANIQNNLAIANAIAQARPERIDARYYAHPSDVYTQGGLLLDQWNPPSDDYLLDEVEFWEATARYSRMGNLITTRSDIFEIIVLAQTGVVPDGGNFRTDFDVLAERRIRTVYER